MGEARQDKVVFLVASPPADVPRMQTMLGYALAAVSMGFDVIIFFTLDGIHTLKKKVFEKLDKTVQERLQECIKAGCKIWGCSSAAATFNIKPEDIIEGAQIMGIASFYNEAATAKVVLTW